MTSVLPAGYVRVTAGRCMAVALREHEDDARALLMDGTLYEAAARNLSARSLAGRGVAYAIDLPVSALSVVVRHNRHGGLLAPVTRDFFLPPTRAPYELEVSLRLAVAGIRTPPLVMYGIERRFGLLRRADVVTREVPDARDLASYLASGESSVARSEAWTATAHLVRALNREGARHHDLNVKNVLLATEAAGLQAWVLDVDRVRFGVPGSKSVREGNVTRLRRSATKWKRQCGAEFDEDELAI